MRDKNKPRILRGDIIYVNLGQKVNNSVQSGVRPCVVISNNVSNNKSDILNIYPFTTKLKKNPVHEVIKPGDVKGYFQADSDFLGEQPMTVGYNQVVSKVGHIDEKSLVMKRIEKAILYQYGMLAKEGDTIDEKC